jgi:hypothetical protein
VLASSKKYGHRAYCDWSAWDTYRRIIPTPPASEVVGSKEAVRIVRDKPRTVAHGADAMDRRLPGSFESGRRR